MALFLRCLFFTTFWAVTIYGSPFVAKPTWTFSVVVAVEKRTADFYQFAYSKPITQLVNEQVATINANFNSSPNFNGIYNFRVDSVYVFDGAVSDEINRPHPKYMYGIVINGFSGNTSGGGWYGSSQTIYHNWKWDHFDGPFTPTATDGLTHDGTDLTPTLVLPQANFAASGSVANLVVNLFEVAGLPTAMSNVAITITAPLDYMVAFDPASTSIKVSGRTDNPVAVDNVNWSVTSALADRQLSLGMKANQFIRANGKAALGFTITRTTANSGSVSSITVNITNDATMGYEGNPANNVYARIINGL